MVEQRQPSGPPLMFGNWLPIVAMVFLLAGCSQFDSRIYPLVVDQNVVGNETYVTVSNVWNEIDALPLAEKHCRTYGKAARFHHMEGHRAIYDCVQI